MDGEAVPEAVMYVESGLAVPAHLDRLHDLLRAAVSQHSAVPAEALMMFETAVMEIAANVVEHGRPLGEVLWRFELSIGPGSLAAVLSDSGEQYESLIDGDMPDEWAESGRGIPLAAATLHELKFRRHGGINQWRMVRNYEPVSPETAAP